MRLTIIGAGYVGLVAGACFADAGNDVVLVDGNPDRIHALNTGKLPIYEPGLADLIARTTGARRLSFSHDAGASIPHSDMVILAVGTPSTPDGLVDLSSVLRAADTIGTHLREGAVVVTKSTVPVGFHRTLRQRLEGRTTNAFAVVSNPEFLKEGRAVRDFMSPDRVVVGADRDWALSRMRALYAPFLRRSERIFVMDPTSAELTKYASNAMLASRISLMNEIARLADAQGADIELVRRGMGADPRIGEQFLYPSLGFGGGCLPKDVDALANAGQAHGLEMAMARSIKEVNDSQCDWFFSKILQHFQTLKGRTVAVWGLAFKARTDDIRESSGLRLIGLLLEHGADVQAHDPAAAENARRVLPSTVSYSQSAYGCLEGADALVICTEWQEYRSPDFQRMCQLLSGSVIFDGRNLYDLDQMSVGPFTYVSVGRPVIRPRHQEGD